MNLNSELNAFIADKCDHPLGKDLPNRAVCRRCAIRYAEKRVGDEIEMLYQAIRDETGHLTLASLLNEYKALKEAQRSARG